MLIRETINKNSKMKIILGGTIKIQISNNSPNLFNFVNIATSNFG